MIGFLRRLSAFLIVFMAIATSVSATLSEVKLLTSDGMATDYFGGRSGKGVAISGDYAIVGADSADPDGAFSGAAYIFHFDGDGWVEQQKLTASDGAANNRFGDSVAICGNTAIVGAFYGDGNVSDSGAAYVYQYDGAQWVEQQKLVATDGTFNAHFGESVSISGDYAIVGAWLGNIYTLGAGGAAYIFRYDGANWVEEQKLAASDTVGANQFGFAVSISDNYALVGAPNDRPGYLGGSAYIFHYNGTTWAELQRVAASDSHHQDHFGSAVSISGSNAIIGAAYGESSTQDSGSAYVYHYDGATWIEQQRLQDNFAIYDKKVHNGIYNNTFGRSVSISENFAIVSGNIYSGEAHLYHYDGRKWIETEKLIASDTASMDLFGESVAISGNRAIVGAPGDDDNGSMSGSAYIFDGLADCMKKVCKAEKEGKGKTCSDGIDNDGDLLIDCADPGCSTHKVCS